MPAKGPEVDDESTGDNGKRKKNFPEDLEWILLGIGNAASENNSVKDNESEISQPPSNLRIGVALTGGILLGILSLASVVIFFNNWREIISDNWTTIEMLILTVSLIGLVIASNAFILVIRKSPADPKEIIDELTDSVAIFAIVPITLWGDDPSQTVFLAIVSIALGKRVLKYRQETNNS